MPNDPDFTAREILFDDFPPVSTAAWHEKIAADLKGADFDDRLVWHPTGGFDVQPFYRSGDLDALPEKHAQILTATRRSTNEWRVRQDIAHPDPVEANRLARDACSRGADSLGFMLTGRNGTPIRRQKDMARLLEGLSLDETSLHLLAGPEARPMLSLLLNEATHRGLEPAALSGSVAFDPMAYFARRGRLSPTVAFDGLRRLVEDVEQAGVSLRVLRVDATPYDESGASAVQTLACFLAAVSETLAQLTERGLSVESLVRRMCVRMPVGTSYFVEIAKLRAIRLLFARLVEAFTPDLPAPRPFVEALTSRWSLTVFDPYANLLRGTTEAAAAILGGCDELTVHPFDAATGHSSDDAYRLARNTQLLLRHEARLDKVADPAAGSYYLEMLTHELARHAWAFFQEIEARGGLLVSLTEGYIQKEIATVRAKREQDVASGRRAFVGVNRFPDVDERRQEAPTEDAATLQPRFLEVPEALAALRQRLRAGGSLDDFPDAAAQQMEALPLPAVRGVTAFEAMRQRTGRYATSTGRRPRVFLLMMGEPVMANARATFSRNFFGSAGFDVLAERRFDTPEAGARAAREQEAEIVVLCSSDPEYTDLAPPLCAQLKRGGVGPLVVVAGYPADHIEPLEAVGVDAFIHRKSPVLNTLEDFQERLGLPV